MEIKTICRDCVFAEIGEVDGLTIQTGCEFKRVEKFLEQGKASLIKNETEINKPLKQYYEINRYCNNCRNTDWLQRVLLKKKHPIDVVLEETYPTLAIVFILRSEEDLTNLHYTCQEIQNQTFDPDEFIVLNNSGKNSIKVSDIIDSYLKDKNLIWRQIRPIYSYSDPLYILLDNLQKVDSKFIAVLEKKNIDRIPLNIRPRLHQSLNVNLDRWILLKDIEYFPFITTKNMLQNLISKEIVIEEGMSADEIKMVMEINEELDIINKIEKISKLNKEENYIKNFDYLGKI